MNDRIKEIILEHGLGKLGCTSRMEMLAELVVKECISCVGSQADKAYLKKHFGLPVESDIIYPATDESWSVETQYKRKYNLAPDPNPDMGGI